MKSNHSYFVFEIRLRINNYIGTDQQVKQKVYHSEMTCFLIRLTNFNLVHLQKIIDLTSLI